MAVTRSTSVLLRVASRDSAESPNNQEHGWNAGLEPGHKEATLDSAHAHFQLPL